MCGFRQAAAVIASNVDVHSLALTLSAAKREAMCAEQASLEGGADIVRGPGVRGLLGAGAASGDLLLLDPASGFKVSSQRLARPTMRLPGYTVLHLLALQC